MKQKVNLILDGVTCSTNLDDAETAKLLDGLRESWMTGNNMMITVTDSADGAMPMHIRASAVQAVIFGEVAP